MTDNPNSPSSAFLFPIKTDMSGSWWFNSASDPLGNRTLGALWLTLDLKVPTHPGTHC